MAILFAAAMGGDGASSTQIPVAAGRAASDLSNGVRFSVGDRVAVARPWLRSEWDRLPAEAKPPVVGFTADGRFVVALDIVEA